VDHSLVGQTLGHYRILDQLGAGGMGVVYRAQDSKLGRQVALKVLPAGSASNEEAVERFRREARTASALNHPNICTIYGFDEHDGQLYLAMELLDGEPLDQRLSGKPLDLRQVLDIGAQVADALDAAHAEGILHRDVKPANIFLTRRGPVKVLDFGLAKLSPSFRRNARQFDAGHQTHVPEHFTSVAGTTVGTIAYMSPEQARGEDVDPRTDLFSFGVVLYEMATGRQSFPGHTTAVVFDGILNRDPAAPSTLNASIPPELDRIVSKALEKDRTLRYQSSADIGADLKRLRRDASSRQVAVATSLSGVDPEAMATVVVPSSSGVAAAPAPASSTHVAAPGAAPPAAPAPRPPLSAVTKSAVRSPAVWGAGAGVIAIAAIAAAIGAYVATRPGEAVAPVNETAAAPAAAAAPVNATPVAAAPASTPAPASAPPAAAAARPAGTGTTAAANATPAGTRAAATKPATKTPPAAAAPAPVSRDAEATQRLDVARAKAANNLNDQALADLREIIIEYPGSRAGAEASLLAAELHEKAGRLEDAMASYVEFESRFAGDRRAAESKMRRAAILGRSRLPRAQQQSRELMTEIARDYPGTPQANVALQNKIKIETDRKDLKEFDPVLKIEVPAVMVSLRTLIAQFPDGPQSMPARNRLAMMLSQMNRHADAAQVLEDLGARYPGNPMDVWFRLGELYERRLNDPVKAKEAFAKVPPGSPRYADAQRRLKRR
jgi:serine/threonine protein kinase/TolA-binding protein